MVTPVTGRRPVCVSGAGAPSRTGTSDVVRFAYGTLPGHAESGEERFLVEWDRTTDAVHYDILAFSRPRHPLARLGYPLTRRVQRRFARDSATAMRRAVAGVPTP
jgi:uncharacterized protein (UPF0548 family)